MFFLQIMDFIRCIVVLSFLPSHHLLSSFELFRHILKLSLCRNQLVFLFQLLFKQPLCLLAFLLQSLLVLPFSFELLSLLHFKLLAPRD